MAAITLRQLFKYYKGLPHQSAAIQQLEEDIVANGYAVAMDRSRPWFQAWSQDGKQNDLSAAVSLIKEFEGCHLSAYPDPLTGDKPWTIGYGTTRYSNDAPVKRGDTITLKEAEDLLRLEVERIVSKLHSVIPHWNAMSGGQQSALVSFAYNLGAGFYNAPGFETISRCLRDRKWSEVPKALELYRNPGTAVEAGLLRRRRAEGRVWGDGPAPAGPRLTLGSSFAEKVTPHIRLGEFALDQEERRFDHQYQLEIAVELADFLEKARATFGGKPVVITSGYRPPAVNRAVGGASNSEHLFQLGCGAVDFYIDGVDIKTLQSWCDMVWPYSIGYGAAKGFVHVGIRNSRPRVRWNY